MGIAAAMRNKAAANSIGVFWIDINERMIERSA
jgi:hypothetical protein